ncbi:FtsB family cell division protein [Aquipuribacter nitratireducens]|uniref:Septum formation initiator family protein n=1 Tax=Aquipuribacter nitratireducens TaxID=650104 RepID=A0ABW0GJ88_9MICO
MTRSTTARGRGSRAPVRAPARQPAREPGGRTRRVVVLLALGVVFALVLAPPMRLFVEQQRDIRGLRAEIAQGEADVAALQEQVDLWHDDAYVAAQARERLGMVRPGEVGYVVPAPPETSDAAASEDVLERPDAAPEGTWYGRLWSSVEAVGAGAAGDPVLDAPVVSDSSTTPATGD